MARDVANGKFCFPLEGSMAKDFISLLVQLVRRSLRQRFANRSQLDLCDTIDGYLVMEVEKKSFGSLII